MNYFKYVGLVLILAAKFSLAQEPRSMYLQSENFETAGQPLPITTDEAKIVSEKWRKNLSIKSKEVLTQFRADSYMEYDMRAIGGTYSYYFSTTLFNYIAYILTEKNFYPEEFQAINCAYEQINMNLVVEQCALPSRKKPAVGSGFQQSPPVFTYAEIQKDLQGPYIKGSKVYISK